MKALIAGGGTGGHLFPAVAVGEALLRLDPTHEVTYVGASNGLEARWLPAHHLPHHLLQIRGWTGKGPLTRARALKEFAIAVARSRKIIDQFRPTVVIGAGGYASAPVALAALLRRIPLVLLEQNTRAGLANRLLGRFAQKVCLGFAEAAPFFPPSKVVVTGNPIRFEPCRHQPLKGRDQTQILVLGGSSGAHRLNLGILNAFRICGNNVIDCALVHQTGEADAEMVAGEYRALERRATVVAFIDDMARALSSADLIIARSGAMTVSEVALAGAAALFVPYPFHRDRQQELNAATLVNRGAARIVRDDDQLGENLAKELQVLTRDRAALSVMRARAAAAAKPHAADTVARLCVELGQGTRQ